jgi:hypothetical protein
MPIADPDRKHTITLSRKALVFLTNCMSRRGGQHPGDDKKFADAYMEAQDAVLFAFGEPPIETCTALDQTTIYTECNGKHQKPAEVLKPTRDDLLEEVASLRLELQALKKETNDTTDPVLQST